MKEHIDEMGFIIRENSPLTTISSEDVAEALYNAGYRKQSEGEWKPSPSGSTNVYCSLCGAMSGGGIYCSHCGAKMKGGAE